MDSETKTQQGRPRDEKDRVVIFDTTLRDGEQCPGATMTFDEKLEDWLDAHGLDALDPYHRPGHHPGDLARPRALDVALAMNRLRSARFVQP